MSGSTALEVEQQELRKERLKLLSEKYPDPRVALSEKHPFSVLARAMKSAKTGHDGKPSVRRRDTAGYNLLAIEDIKVMCAFFTQKSLEARDQVIPFFNNVNRLIRELLS